MGNPIREIKPREELDLLLRKWYMLALFGILGGLVGFGISVILPPQYEARAALQITIFLPEGQFYTDAQTDYLLHSAIEIVSSAPMLQQMVAGLQGEGNDIRTDDFTLERRESYWDLVVRSRDPELAAQAANAWLDETLIRLEEAGSHSQRASELAVQLELLKACPTKPVQPLCSSFSNAGELYDLIVDLMEQYRQEEIASLGLSPSLTWRLENRASVPTSPVIYGRSTLILAGTGIGLLLGLPVPRIQFRKRGK